MNRKQLARLERLLSRIGSEKRTKVVTFKVEYSLWQALKLVTSNVSGFIHDLVFQRLEKELNEAYE